MEKKEIVSAYAAARTPFQLVDREPILDQILKAVQDPSHSLRVFYITGDGGIGKSVLLHEVLRNLSEGGRWASKEVLVATGLIDFYHPHTHSIEGLCQAIREVLRPGMGYFNDFEARYRQIESQRDRLETPTDLDSERMNLTTAFLQDLDRMTDDYRLVLPFDTSEALQYEMDEIQELLGVATEGIAACPWLLNEFLPKIKNTVVLIAGRPYPEQLRIDLRKALPQNLEEIEVGPLAEDDTLDYFNMVARAAQESKNAQEIEIAEQITALPEDTRRVIHRYTGGRPIMLSLVLDYLVIARRLMPQMGDSLEEARAKTPEELAEIGKMLEAEIARALQETGRPADEAIRLLGWTRRGLSAEMMAFVQNIALPEAESLLDSLKALSFIKVRPDDQRLFLQDEMYRLLQEHVLSQDSPRARRTFQRLVAFYEQELEGAQSAQYRLQAESDPDPDALAQARRRLQNAIVERTHYALRADPEEGFVAYSRAAEAAFLAYHEEIDMQLRTELLNYLREAPETDRKKIEDRAAWDAGMRWIKRNIVKARYEEAIKLAESLRRKAKGVALMARLAPVAEAQLNVWEAWARIYAGEALEWVEGALRQAIRTFQEPGLEESYGAMRAYLLPRAYHALGYYLSRQGSYREAAQAYRSALPFWRKVRFETELANTLNNLSWVLAEMGQFEPAMLLCLDALNLRRQRGPSFPIALSINTMAEIQIRADQPHRAEQMARQALRIFREHERFRGIGMARRALAEALRRKSGVPELYSPEKQLEILMDAERQADLAVDIFRDQAPEPSRRVESLIEQGCIFRDWAHCQERYKLQSGRSLKDLVDRGRATLDTAAEIAQEDYPHLALDAKINLAWLYFFVDQDDEALKAVDEALALIDRDYFYSKETGAPSADLPIASLWVQIGKGHLLRGLVEIKSYQREYRQLRDQGQSSAQALAEKKGMLAQAAGHFCLALAYDALFAPNFRDVRRARTQIYEQFRDLNVHEFAVAKESILAVEKAFKIAHPGPLTSFLQESFGEMA